MIALKPKEPEPPKVEKPPEPPKPSRKPEVKKLEPPKPAPPKPAPPEDRVDSLVDDILKNKDIEPQNHRRPSSSPSR